MKIVRRVFFSMVADNWLTKEQNDLKWGIVEEVSKLGYTPEIFSNPRYMAGISSNKSWRADLAFEVMSKCCGAVIIGQARWIFGSGDTTIKLPTEFSHYEGALARSLNIPMLILVQDDVMRRTVFDYNFGQNIGSFTCNDDISWLQKRDFINPFNYWKEELTSRRDLFIGYCGKSLETIKELKQILKKEEVTYLDWLNDFTPADSILKQIEQAASLCSAAIFLFTADDNLSDNTKAKAVPRDNVVFEAGYFIKAKGKNRVLIIKEKDAKMPADLGGDIYGSLQDKSSLGSLEKLIKRFIKHL